MRILHVSWEYPPLVHGGLGRHLHALAEAQAASGHEVIVVTQHTADAALDEVVNGVRVVRAPADPPTLPFDQDHLIAWVSTMEHAFVRAALRLGREWIPEVVHGHDWLVAHAGAALKDAFAIPLVVTMHATEAGRHQGWLPSELSRAIHVIEWWTTFEARRVITCSEHMRWETTRLFDLPPEKIDVIPNGVDLWPRLTRRSGTPEDSSHASGPTIVCAARLEWEKGIHTLVAAMPTLRRRHRGVRLVIAGRGSQEHALREQVRRLRLGRSVSFAGWLSQSELRALTESADVAVAPSLYEPFGLVALEAAAVGTPLVVARTGGLAEIVADGVTGRTFAPGDVRDLVRAVDATLRDPETARAYAASARELLRRSHSWSGIAITTTEVYERAIVEEEAFHAGVSADSPLQLVVRDGNLLHG